MALSIIFDLHRQIATTLYFFDLLGASIGAVSVTFLLQLVGGEAAVLVAAAAPLAAAACLSRKLRLVGIIGALVVCAAALTNEHCPSSRRTTSRFTSAAIDVLAEARLVAKDAAIPGIRAPGAGVIGNGDAVS